MAYVNLTASILTKADIQFHANISVDMAINKHRNDA